MYIPDNYDLFEQYEREQEWKNRRKKRLMMEERDGWNWIQEQETTGNSRRRSK